MKAALLSHVLPGAPSGQGVMLGRLLPGFSEPPLVIASPRATNPGALPPTNPPYVPAGCHEAGPQSAAPVVHLAPDIPARAGNALLPLITLRRAQCIARLLREHHCQALVACSGDLVDLPAGRIAAQLAGVPFVAWLFDPYAGQWPGRAMNLFAAGAERLALTGAAAAIVPNEFAQQLYERRYRLPVSIVRNPLPDGYPFDQPAPLDSASIRYTGAVYRVNGHALHQLASAISIRPTGRMTLDIFAAQDPRYLAVLRAHPAVRLHPHVDQVQALAVQRSAGVLYLPLGRRREFAPGEVTSVAAPSLFNPAGARSVLTQTAAPAKLGEYLASGRPLLACVPSESFVAWYLRQHHAGLVVDTASTEALGSALDTLVAGGPAVARMTANALHRSQCDFAPEAARAALHSVLSGIG